MSCTPIKHVNFGFVSYTYQCKHRLQFHKHKRQLQNVLLKISVKWFHQTQHSPKMLNKTLYVSAYLSVLQYHQRQPESSANRIETRNTRQIQINSFLLKLERQHHTLTYVQSWSINNYKVQPFCTHPCARFKWYFQCLDIYRHAEG